MTLSQRIAAIRLQMAQALAYGDLCRYRSLLEDLIILGSRNAQG